MVVFLCVNSKNHNMTTAKEPKILTAALQNRLAENPNEKLVCSQLG